MKRDWDLIRQQLTDIEEVSNAKTKGIELTFETIKRLAAVALEQLIG